MVSRAQNNSERYTVSRATHWLSNLACGMQEHGQTVFMIEQLQPGWLQSRLLKSVYVLLTRLCIGLLYAPAVFLFLNGLGIYFKGQENIWDQMISALDISGILILGLSFGIADLHKALSRKRITDYAAESNKRKTWKSFKKFWFIYFLMLFLFFFRDGALELSGSEESAMVAFYTLAALYWSIRSSFRTIKNDIQPSKAVRWINKSALKGGLLGLLVGFVLPWFLLGIFELDQFSENDDLNQVGFAVYLCLIGAFFGGFQKTAFVSETVPNYGITRSAKSALRMSIWLAGLSGAVTMILLVMYASENFQVFEAVNFGETILASASVGAGFGAFATLRYGIMDVSMHYILRSMLAITNYLPLNLAHFLNYATRDLKFMQKVGGGYIFMHRSLLEHFAEQRTSRRGAVVKSQPAE